MVVPLVASSMIAGVLQLGSSTSISSISGKTLLYYSFSGLFAVIIGLVLVNWIEPGRVDPSTARALLGEAAQISQSSGLLERVEGKDSSDLLAIFQRMFPTNIFKAASDNGQLLGIILFSVLFGLFAGRLPEPMRTFQCQFWESSQKVILGITEWIIRFAPIGVFGLVLPILYRAPIGELMQTLSAFLFYCFSRIAHSPRHPALSLLKMLHFCKPTHSFKTHASRFIDRIFYGKFFCNPTLDHGRGAKKRGSLRSQPPSRSRSERLSIWMELPSTSA